MESNPVIVESVGDGAYQARVHAQGPSFMVDEPVDLGGTGSGPTPYDLLSGALGACTNITVRLYAQRKRWPLAHVQVSVAHRRDPATGRDIFERTLYIEGDLDEKQRARLLEIAEHCPVERTLHDGSNITTRMVTEVRKVHPGKPCDETHPKAVDEACREVDPTATA
jgi:putative redox protein